MELKRLSDLVVEIRAPYDGCKEFLLLSDIHFDHPHCDRKTYFSLLDEAVRRGARILYNGDFFCMMQVEI